MDATEYFDHFINICRDVFIRKNEDYGTAWRILRPSSLTDQIYIKAKRIRTVQEAGLQRVEDEVDQEFLGIINYCIIALIQLKLKDEKTLKMSISHVLDLFDKEAQGIKALLGNKNHDYGAAWREMRVSSMTDLILMKILRIKQIEDNEGKTSVSEGIDANYQDIVNYALFCLIQLKENHS